MQPIPETNEYQHCRHCGRRQNTWLWRLIEIYPQPLYEILCYWCHTQQLSTFTPEHAIEQAIIIIGIYQGMQRPAALPKDGAA